MQFKRLKPEQKKDFQSQDQKLKKLQVERRKVDGVPVKEGKSWKPTDIKKPVRLKKPVSPIKANPDRTPVFERPRGNLKIINASSRRIKLKIDLKLNSRKDNT